LVNDRPPESDATTLVISNTTYTGGPSAASR